MSNFSNSCINNLKIYHDLIEYGSVSYNDYQHLKKYQFKRYIGNIRFMLQDNFIYDKSIVYDYKTNRYVLER